MSGARKSAPVMFSAPVAERLRSSDLRVVVTGASGWMGQATLEALEQAFGRQFDQRVAVFGSHSRELALRSGRRVRIIEVGALEQLSNTPTMLLHYAFLTKDRIAGLSTQDYYARSAELAASVEDAIARIGVRRMLFPSSGAVYGQPMRAERSTIEEPERNPYGTQKLRDEGRFAVACARQGARLAIPRIFSLSGPFINKHEAYALASIINCALRDKPVEIRARRPVYRSYVGVRDLLDISVGWLLAADEPAQIVFDTGGETVEVGELARRALRILDRPQHALSRPPMDGSAEDRYVGADSDFQRLSASLGVVPAALDTQIVDTAAYLAESSQ